MCECNRKVRILLCGGAFKGNLGAPAMYDSIIDELKKHIPNLEVTVLSKYPKDDRIECDHRGYRMIAYPTVKQVTMGCTFFVMGGLLKLLHISCHWMARNDGALNEYFENDILVDASGISFTDDRSFTNILINTLWFLPGIISGISMVKMSQTMGPYNKWYVKMFARIVLKKLDFMVCRGNKSYEYTKKFLRRKNIYNLPDTAFCLKMLEDKEAVDLLRKYNLKTEDYIAVGPSYVMRDYFDNGIYSDIVASALNNLSKKTGMKILFVPHSWLHSAQFGADTVNDDLAVCREIAKKLDQDNGYEIVEEEMSARNMKALIGRSYMAIGSRYHFLIAALSSGVASMALGWSHKYREAFQEFNIEEYVLEYQNMNVQSVNAMTEKLYENRDSVRDKIHNNLESVIQRSAKNEQLIVDLLKKRRII